MHVLCEEGYITAVECDFEISNSNASCAYVSSNSVKSSFVNCNTAETFSYTAESTKNVMVSYNNDLIGDLNSAYTDYKRQSKKPQKQVI